MEFAKEFEERAKKEIKTQDDFNGLFAIMINHLVSITSNINKTQKEQCSFSSAQLLFNIVIAIAVVMLYLK